MISARAAPPLLTSIPIPTAARKTGDAGRRRAIGPSAAPCQRTFSSDSPCVLVVAMRHDRCEDAGRPELTEVAAHTTITDRMPLQTQHQAVRGGGATGATETSIV